MTRQRGLALTGLIIWAVVVALVAILSIRVLPEVIDYYKIRQAVKAVATDSNGRSVAELRSAFSKYAEVEHIKTLTPTDLDIYKEDNQVVIAFAYEKRIPLIANVSLLIEFNGASRGNAQ
ncbi:MAG TPA: DUF4845 domain-containing protein [Accumulibacter sp.]|nr:DUF4845 domain-containing protein [Accumulibacter sp.]HMW17016.1 DUF4845 domain-containing protein [Accumulibacter sp.]HNC17268.1 DUF4845 domain-containing protein [Accumulibacter sp.]HND79838.1 DUF4845 domain-containing protein [Accumulibacter sp.]HNE13993.1 DUF4845 domain-containing protein [Accumulibacter sp.]